MSEENQPVFVPVELEALKEIIKQLKSSLEPKVPYKRDPLHFCQLAHEVKDEHVKNALALLPEYLVSQVEVQQNGH